MGIDFKSVNVRKKLKLIIVLAIVSFIFLVTAGVWASYLSYKLLKQSAPVVELNTKAEELKNYVNNISTGLSRQSCREELLQSVNGVDWNLNSLESKLQTLRVACLGATESQLNKEGTKL